MCARIVIAQMFVQHSDWNLVSMRRAVDDDKMHCKNSFPLTFGGNGSHVHCTSKRQNDDSSWTTFRERESHSPIWQRPSMCSIWQTMFPAWVSFDTFTYRLFDGVLDELLNIVWDGSRIRLYVAYVWWAMLCLMDNE